MDTNKKNEQKDQLDSVRELLDNTLNSLDAAMGNIQKSTEKTVPIDLKSINAAANTANKTENNGDILTDDTKTIDTSAIKQACDDADTAVFDRIIPESDVVIKTQKVKSPQEDAVSAKESSPETDDVKLGDVKLVKDNTEPKKPKRRGIREHKKFFYLLNSIVITLVFAATAVSLAVLKRPSGFMSSENRNYAEFPEFTVKSYFDAKFTSGINTWFTDTTPHREELKSIANHFTDLFGFKLDDTVIQSAGGKKKHDKFDDNKKITTATAVVFPKTSQTQTTAQVAGTEPVTQAE